MVAGDVSEQFRSANSRLAVALASRDLGADVPFICECGDPACFASVPMTIAEFERVCDEGGYAIVRGHSVDADIARER